MANRNSIIKGITDWLKNQPEDSSTVAAISALIDGVTVPHIPGSKEPVMPQRTKPMMIDGKVNPEAIIEERDIIVEFNRQWANYYGHQWPRYDDQIKLVMANAKQLGVDIDAYAPETFTLSDIREKNDIFAASEKELIELEAKIERMQAAGNLLIDDAKKKRWVDTLKRCARLQRLCRQEMPDEVLESGAGEVEQLVWRSLHPLRYMLYVTRSELMSGDDGEPKLVETPHHLLMMCMVVWITRRYGVEQGINGSMVRIAPRHGKTNFVVSDVSLDINMRPSRIKAIVHNVKEIAAERVQKVKDHFLNTTPEGRRRRALFPNIAIHPKDKDSKERFSVLVDGRRASVEKEGTLSARGIHGRAQGITIHDIYFDDPSDEKEQLEEGTRLRTNSAMSKTWMRRLTGKTAFYVYTCTVWHPDDFGNRLMKMARKGEIQMSYYGRACGGPEDGFKPIWPEAGYDAKFLEKAFHQLGASQYACVYRNDPDAEETRKVSRFTFYDSRLWTDVEFRLQHPEWKAFFTDPATRFILTGDPAGSTKKRSNLAGLMLWAFGPMMEKKNNAKWRTMKLVALGKWGFQASQHMFSDRIASIDAQMRIDEIVLETGSGFHATPDDLVIRQGIPESKIRRVTVVHKGDKVKRFTPYAMLIERGEVLYPGEPAGGVLRLVDSWNDYAEQIFHAGSTNEDQYLDCTYLILQHCASEMKSKHSPDPKPPTMEHADARQLRSMFEKWTKKEKPDNRLRIPSFANASSGYAWMN